MACLEEMDYNAHTSKLSRYFVNSVQVARLHCYFRYAASAICSAVYWFECGFGL